MRHFSPWLVTGAVRYAPAWAHGWNGYCDSAINKIPVRIVLMLRLGVGILFIGVVQKIKLRRLFRADTDQSANSSTRNVSAAHWILQYDQFCFEAGRKRRKEGDKSFEMNQTSVKLSKTEYGVNYNKDGSNRLKPIGYCATRPDANLPRRWIKNCRTFCTWSLKPPSFCSIGV